MDFALANWLKNRHETAHKDKIFIDYRSK